MLDAWSSPRSLETARSNNREHLTFKNDDNQVSPESIKEIFTGTVPCFLKLYLA